MKKRTLISFISSKSTTGALWGLTKLQQLIAIMLATFTISVLIISGVIMIAVCDPFKRIWRK